MKLRRLYNSNRLICVISEPRLPTGFDCDCFVLNTSSLRPVSYTHLIDGEWIGRSSYILVFKDETYLDLDGYTSVQKTEKYIRPILKNHVKPVRHVRSEAEIASPVAEHS